MAATSTYSTVAYVVFFGEYIADSLSSRSSGTRATPMCASRGFEYPRSSSLALVRILNREVLPTWGRPIMPVFICFPKVAQQDEQQGEDLFDDTRRGMFGSGVRRAPLRTRHNETGCEDPEACPPKP